MISPMIFHHVFYFPSRTCTSLIYVVKIKIYCMWNWLVFINQKQFQEFCKEVRYGNITWMSWRPILRIAELFDQSLFRQATKKASLPRITGSLWGNLLVIDAFPSKETSNLIMRISFPYQYAIVYRIEVAFSALWRSSNVIMMVANGLATSRCQTISSYYSDYIVTMWVIHMFIINESTDSFDGTYLL